MLKKLLSLACDVNRIVLGKKKKKSQKYSFGLRGPLFQNLNFILILFGLFFVKDISFLFYKFSRYLPDYNYIYIYIQKKLIIPT